MCSVRWSPAFSFAAISPRLRFHDGMDGLRPQFALPAELWPGRKACLPTTRDQIRLFSRRMHKLAMVPVGKQASRPVQARNHYPESFAGILSIGRPEHAKMGVHGDR